MTTKAELKQMLEEAWRNTAAIGTNKSVSAPAVLPKIKGTFSVSRTRFINGWGVLNGKTVVATFASREQARKRARYLNTTGEKDGEGLRHS